MTRRYQYGDAEGRRETLRKRLRAAGFKALVASAEAGDTEPLREYLQSSVPLSEEHRDLLAALIYRRLQRKGRGKRGDRDLRPHEDAVRRVAFEVRKLQAARGYKNLSKDRLEQLCDEVGGQLGTNGYFDDLRHKISMDDVRSALRRLPRRPPRR